MSIRVLEARKGQRVPGVDLTQEPGRNGLGHAEPSRSNCSLRNH